MFTESRRTRRDVSEWLAIKIKKKMSKSSEKIKTNKQTYKRAER